MKSRLLADMHIHSINSPDGTHSVSYICECAMKRGLEVIAITDHFEVMHEQNHVFERSLQQCCLDVLKAREAFKNDLTVLLGIELGQPLHNLPVAERILDEYKFDFVLASVHNLQHEEDFAFIDLNESTAPTYLDRYFAELEETAQWAKFDSLAHLFYPLRYIKPHMQPDAWDEQIDRILATVAKNGRALEINTSGYRQWSKDANPPLKYVRRFHELGGQYVTIGSDAHVYRHLGYGVDKGMDVAKEAGFQNVCYYENRAPVAIPLD